VNIRSRLLYARVMAFLLTSAGWHSGAEAAEIRERTIKLPIVTTIDAPLGIGAAKFSELVGQKSGGKIKVKVFPGASLGGEAQVVSAAQGGTIEATIVLPAVLSSMVKDFLVLDLPYVFDSEQHAARVLDGPVGKHLQDQLRDKNLVGLGFMGGGFRNYSNSKHQISKAEDMSGLKLRSFQNPVFIDFTNALGANAVPLAFSELYTALETKAIDGQENTIAQIDSSRFNEVQKFLSETRHVYAPQITVIGRKFWDQLSADERKLLQEAATEAAEYQRKAAIEAEGRSRDTLRARGMQINTISEQEMARFRAKVKPVVEKHTSHLSEGFRELFFEEVAKAR
jgi:tripartite ATP-independent transporter DctP family solute receptor